MRKLISLILALLILLSATTALADTGTAVDCPEEHFSTSLDFDYAYKWVDGDGLYIYAKQEGKIPYILIATDYSDGRVTDGATFLHDEMYPLIKEWYSAYGGTSFMGHGSYTVVGKDMAAAEFQYKDSAGYSNYLIYAVDVMDDCSVYYRVKFDTEDDRQMMTDLLETVVANAVIGDSAAQDAQTDANDIVEIHCEQAGFTTRVNFDHGTMWEDGSGLYIYTWGPDTIPYVLVNVAQSDVQDLNTYIRDNVTPQMKEDYGDALRMYTEYEYYTIGGKDLPAASYTYDVEDYRVTMLRAYDNRDGNIVIYTAKYVYDKDKQPTLDALDMIAGNLTLDVEPASAPALKGQDTTAAAGALAFKVTPIEQGGMVMGRCTAPEDYEVMSQAFCNTKEQSAGCPWQLRVAASNGDGCLLRYESGREYIANATGTTEDGGYNMTYFTPMLHYMTAAEYCDYIAGQLAGTITRIEVVEENNYPERQAELREKAAASMKLKNSQLNPLGLSIDKEVYDYCTRRYYVETDAGLKLYYCVSTGTIGSWLTARMNGPIVSTTSTAVLWDVPYVYTMLCPAHLWDEQGAAFKVFAENTTVSDQFLIANQKLSQDLWDIITGRKRTDNLDAYSQKVMRDATSEGSDYDDERFTDYIFDQNDYTLSDGSHVKVPTSYDYVAEGDNGNVYYSDSLDAIPQWATQLTPNR